MSEFGPERDAPYRLAPVEVEQNVARLSVLRNLIRTIDESGAEELTKETRDIRRTDREKYAYAYNLGVHLMNKALPRTDGQNWQQIVEQRLMMDGADSSAKNGGG